MNYSIDTGFVLALFSHHPGALQIFEDTRKGKTRLFISMIVYAESIKKLLQSGIKKSLVFEFFSNLETSDKIQLIVIDASVAREASLLSLTYALSLADSFIAATSKLFNCNALLTSDSDYIPLVKNGYLKTSRW